MSTNRTDGPGACQCTIQVLCRCRFQVPAYARSRCQPTQDPGACLCRFQVPAYAGSRFHGPFPEVGALGPIWGERWGPIWVSFGNPFIWGPFESHWTLFYLFEAHLGHIGGGLLALLGSIGLFGHILSDFGAECWSQVSNYSMNTANSP